MNERGKMKERMNEGEKERRRGRMKERKKGRKDELADNTHVISLIGK